MTPKKTCESLGIESVTELALAINKPTRTVGNWFHSEPALFQAILTGVAVQKLARLSGYEAEEALELLRLGMQVKRDAEAMLTAQTTNDRFVIHWRLVSKT